MTQVVPDLPLKSASIAVFFYSMYAHSLIARRQLLPSFQLQSRIRQILEPIWLRICCANSETGKKKRQDVKIISVLRERNSKSILCLQDEAALGNRIWSPVWTVEDQYVQSRYISCLLAALSAEVYTGGRSLRISSGERKGIIKERMCTAPS